MLKDIETRKVDNFGVAMVPSELEVLEDGQEWECFLINLKDQPVHQVLVTSSGYKKSDEEELRSSTLRYFYDRIEGEMAVRLEIVRPELTQLTNEYWISFSLDGHMYDKRFLFVEGSLAQEHLTTVPILNKKGVLIL